MGICFSLMSYKSSEQTSLKRSQKKQVFCCSKTLRISNHPFSKPPKTHQNRNFHLSNTPSNSCHHHRRPLHPQAHQPFEKVLVDSCGSWHEKPEWIANHLRCIKPLKLMDQTTNLNWLAGFLNHQHQYHPGWLDETVSMNSRIFETWLKFQHRDSLGFEGLPWSKLIKFTAGYPNLQN